MDLEMELQKTNYEKILMNQSYGRRIALYVNEIWK